MMSEDPVFAKCRSCYIEYSDIRCGSRCSAFYAPKEKMNINFTLDSLKDLEKGRVESS